VTHLPQVAPPGPALQFPLAITLLYSPIHSILNCRDLHASALSVSWGFTGIHQQVLTTSKTTVPKVTFTWTYDTAEPSHKEVQQVNANTVSTVHPPKIKKILSLREAQFGRPPTTSRTATTATAQQFSNSIQCLSGHRTEVLFKANSRLYVFRCHVGTQNSLYPTWS
jgi:hypothetical protein